MNGSRNGTKNFNQVEIESYLHNLYYNIKSPVAYSSYSKLYPYIKNEAKYQVFEEVVK